MIKSIFNWSGGKDSAFALFKILSEKKYEISCLLTSVGEEHDRISMHGVRVSLLDKQTTSIGIPLQKLVLPESASMQVYDEAIEKYLTRFKEEGNTHCICGDIFLEDLRIYRETQLERVNMKAVFPLWKINTKVLINDFVNLGFKSIVTCVDERYLDKSFAGRIIDENFINDLPANVDPCGENGEFHSFVFDGPIFSQPISFAIGEKVYKQYKSHAKDDETMNGFWYVDLVNN
ncbi:MAG: diphthine--ammonia ligase [Bacteroidales bacterium]|jgi:uncharacterized protein (TIGR00290 family)